MTAMQLGTRRRGGGGPRVRAGCSWPGPPEVSALERLSGRLEISAANGQLTAVEPGAGRVFSLMSLTHLPRRLALDFNDLTGEGLAFDTLSGTFQLTDGDAYTDNVTLRGSAAEIGTRRPREPARPHLRPDGRRHRPARRLARRRRRARRRPGGRRRAAALLADLQGAAQGRDARLLSHHRQLGRSAGAAHRRRAN